MRLLKAVLLVLLILSVVSLGGEAEANDTRNRVLYQLVQGAGYMEYYYLYDPWDTPWGDGTYSPGTLLTEPIIANLVVSKTGAESTDYSAINGYALVNPSVGYNQATGSGIKMEAPVWRIENVNGRTIVTGIKLKISGLEPNTQYSFPTTSSSMNRYIQNSIFINGGVNEVYPNAPDHIKSKVYNASIDKEIGVVGRNILGTGQVIQMIHFNTPFYTPADDPSITISNVTTNKATISWNTNNTNPAGTSYTLRYQVLKENGDPANESDWLPNGSPDTWPIIPVDNQDATTALTTTAEIFQPDHTYRLTVQVNHIADPQYNVYSDYVIFSTSADPAIRAAQEAAIAAQAAKKAAEDSVQYSLDAKNEATGAKNKAQEVYDLVSSLELGGVKEDVSFIKNTMSTPVIQSVKGQNNATATYVNHFTVKINAAGIQENLRYRVVCDGFDSGWTSENIILIAGLTDPGIKTAQIYVSNNATEPDKGSVATKEFVFFKL